MDNDPRDSIKERLRAIKARRKLLAHYVQEDWQLSNEQRALREKHDRLERELTSVKPKRITPGSSTEDKPRNTAKELLKGMSNSERNALIDALKAGLSKED